LGSIGVSIISFEYETQNKRTESEQSIEFIDECCFL